MLRRLDVLDLVLIIAVVVLCVVVPSNRDREPGETRGPRSHQVCIRPFEPDLT